MLGALLLAPVLLLADIWHSPQLATVHRHPLIAAAVALGGLAIIAALAVLIGRRPMLMGALVVVALPFRVPIQAGGTTSNLLVPLYLVVAAASLAFIVPALRNRADPALSSRSDRVREQPRIGWLEPLLAAYVLLYALQSVYSSDFETALQQMVFFYVPFALMFALLRRLQWTPQLIRTCLTLVVALAAVFAGVAFVEYA